MLARTEQLQGVEWAAVEVTGRFLAVRGVPGSDPEAVAAAVEGALGGKARRASPALARSQLDARGRGDPWFTAKEAHALSYIEGRLVAFRATARVGAELKLSRATREALEEAVREAFFAVLERVHAEGGRESTGWFYAEWPRVAEEAARRLTGEGIDAGRVAERLAACYARKQT